MPKYDIQQVCINGHQITTEFLKHPESQKKYCDVCGAETIMKCPNCGVPIQGQYLTDSGVRVGPIASVPGHCTSCGKEFPWTEKNEKEALEKLKYSIQKAKEKYNSKNVINKIFISHSSKDSMFVTLLIDLIEAIGIPQEQIFCTSFEGYGIKLGEDFLSRIKNELSDNTLVLFIISENFYKSEICLCEMGATWIMTQEHIPILIGCI